MPAERVLMKNFFKLGSLLFAALFAGACAARPAGRLKAPADSQLQPLDRIVAALTDHETTVPGRKLVVYEFTDMSRRITPEGRLVAERLTTKLVQTGKFRMIERSRLEAALKELNLQASGIIDENTAIKAGRMLGAEAVITGTIARLNGRFEVNARMISVGTGVIISGQIASLREEELLLNEEYSRQSLPQTVARPKAPGAATAAKTAAPAGWELWPGWNGGNYGSYKLQDGKLYYYLASGQSDLLEAPKDGAVPGMLLAKDLKGERWTLDVKVRYSMGAGSGHWLSCYVWLGPDKIRPNLAHSRTALMLGVQRFRDDGYRANNLYVHRVPGGTSILNPEFSALRIERDRDRFRLLVSLDGKIFEEAANIRLTGPAPETQKLVLGGQSAAISGAYAEYEYIKLNGKPLF